MSGGRGHGLGAEVRCLILVPHAFLYMVIDASSPKIPCEFSLLNISSVNLFLVVFDHSHLSLIGSGPNPADLADDRAALRLVVEAALDPLRALVLVASHPGGASAGASASHASSGASGIAEAMARVGNVSGDALRELYDMRLSEMFVRFVE